MKSHLSVLVFALLSGCGGGGGGGEPPVGSDQIATATLEDAKTALAISLNMLRATAVGGYMASMTNSTARNDGDVTPCAISGSRTTHFEANGNAYAELRNCVRAAAPGIVMNGAGVSRGGLSASGSFLGVNTTYEYVIGKVTGDLIDVSDSFSIEMQVSDAQIRVGAASSYSGRASVSGQQTLLPNAEVLYVTFNGSFATDNHNLTVASERQIYWDANAGITAGLLGVSDSIDGSLFNWKFTFGSDGTIDVFDQNNSSLTQFNWRDQAFQDALDAYAN